MFDNIIKLTDSYKVSHAVQYPPGTTEIESYFESRGGEYRETAHAGLQYFLRRYLEGQVVTKEKIDAAERFLLPHLGPGIFQRARWDYILEKHNGRLPVEIRSVAEGTIVPTGNVLMTIRNTDPECFWLTNYLETLLVQVWYPSTVATISREMKKILLAGLEKSGTPALIDYKLHDFGFRGVSSVESAGLGGFGHLVNFKGTDTMAALEVCEEIYHTPGAGHSIPAAEHSTITSWGKDGEVDAFRNMLTQFPEGLVAVVSDSWNIYHACKHLWGRELKSQVLSRKNGFVVIRPDSGDPTKVLPEILDILGKEFGALTNDKGYKVLPDQVRIIQGDGIRRSTLKGICDAVMAAGWSLDNLAFGSGGGLLQDCNRDTQNYAFKCSRAVVNGEERDVFKSPVGASWKKSKKGKLVLVKHRMFETATGSQWATLQESDWKCDVNTGMESDRLMPVFRDGKLLAEYSLDEVRTNAAL